MPSRSDHKKGGIVSNVDHRLDPVEKAALEKRDEDVQRFVDYKRDRKTSERRWHGVIAPRRSGPDAGKVILPHDQINVTPEQIRLKWQQGKVPKPIGFGPDGRPLLDDEVKEAWRLGYACPNCWNAQESIIDPNCQIKGKDHGCGYKRSLDGW